MASEPTFAGLPLTVIECAIELAAAGCPDGIISETLSVPLASLQHPELQAELRRARAATIARLYKVAIEGASAADARQLLRVLVGSDLGGDESRKPATVMVQPGSVSAALEKQRAVLDVQFDELDPST